MSAVGLIAVPTATEPELPAEGLGLTEVDGLSEPEGLREAEGEIEALDEALGERLLEGDSEDEGDPLAELEGESEDDGLMLVEDEGETLCEGLMLAEILDEAEELGEVEGSVRLLVTRPNTLMRTAPVTVKSVAVPTAPAPVRPVKVMVLVAWSDQSMLVTELPFRLY